MQIDLNLGDPFQKQLEFLRLNRKRVDPKTGQLMLSRSNYVGGRGCSKTTTGILLLLKAVSDMPGLRGAWREPRWPDIERVFLTALREIVPMSSGLWRLTTRNGHQVVVWRNGHETELLSRQVDSPQKRVGLGSNYAYCIEDEAADKFALDKFVDVQNAIRLRTAPYLFHDTLSTPIVGGYEAWCKQPDAVTVHATSYDNPYISQAVIDSWRYSMSPELVRQEINGEFIPQAGRIWTTFSEEIWPKGNIVDGLRFDPQRPWYLACDLGSVQSAFQIVQYYDPQSLGGRAFRGDGRLAVVVAEITANNKGLGAVIDGIIIPQFCGGLDKNGFPARGPIKVIVGSDVVTGGNSGIPGAQTFQALGWKYETPTAVLAGKDVQRNAAMSLILNDAGERRMAVSAKRRSDGIWVTNAFDNEGKTRGILHVMRSDTYPPPQSRELFWKDKPTRGVNALEDDRDAFLYWAVVNHPPGWGKGAHRALEVVR